MTLAFLGNQALLGVVPEVTYGTTPSPGTLAALTNAFVFQSKTLKKTGRIVERDGLRGTRSHDGDDAAVGPYRVAGRLSFEPTPIDVHFWLPQILGSAPSGASYSLAETVPSFTVGLVRGPKNFRYAGCKVNRATFAGSQGQLLSLHLDLLGQTETVETTAWPSIAADTTAPFIFSNLTLNVNGTARSVRDFELVIDNALVADRYFNSTAIVGAPEGDRIVSLKATLPFSSQNTDLYDPGLPGFSGASLVFSSGSHTTTFNFGLLQAPADSPTAARRQENFLMLEWAVRATGATPEIAVTST